MTVQWSRRSCLYLGGAALLGVCGASVVEAQSASSINDIIKGLAPREGQIISDGKGGGAVVKPGSQGPADAQKERLVLEQETIYIDVERSLDFEIYFEYDSARITPRAGRELSGLGEALQSPTLRRQKYLVAGHTDADGTDAYNLVLSKQRAQAVRSHLIERYAIDPHRLVAHGFGKRRLKTPTAPRAAVNRRVQVALIVGEID